MKVTAISINNNPKSDTQEKAVRRNKILVFGTFDILHIGHLRFFREAKRQTDPSGELIVVIARDKNVKEMKEKEPIYNEKDRKIMVSALEIVDKAILGHTSGSKFDILNEIQPDYVILGYDQWVQESTLRRELDKRGLSHTVIKRLTKFGSADLNSSSKVIRRVFKLYDDL